MLVLGMSSTHLAQAQVEAIDAECVRQLGALVDLADQFASSPINGGVYIEEKMELSVKDTVIGFSASALKAYRDSACKAGGLTKTAFLLSANDACSSISMALWSFEFANKKAQDQFYTSLKRLAGDANGTSWDKCPGFNKSELEKDRIKKQ